MMEQSPFRKPQFWLGIIISAACLGAIFLFIDPEQVLAALRGADYRYLVLTVGYIILYLLLRAVRWRFMLGNRISIERTFHIQNVGFMMTQILPLRIGDPARAMLIGSEEEITVAEGLSTMVVERVLDLLAIVVLLPFTFTQVNALPDWMRQGALLSGYLALTAVVVVVAAANFRPKVTTLTQAILKRLGIPNADAINTQVDNLLAGLHTLTSFRSGAKLLGLSALVWLPVLLAYQSVLWSVDVSASLLQTGFIVCATSLSIAAPSSPGQVGVFHAAATFAVTALGFADDAAVSFAFICHAVNFSMLVLLGVIALFRTQSSFGKVLAQTRDFMRQRRAKPESV